MIQLTKRRVLGMVVLTALAISTAGPLGAQPPDAAAIVLVLDAPSELLGEIADAFQAEIETLAEGVVGIASSRVAGDGDRVSVGRALEEAFEASGTSLVVGVGPVASQVLAERDDLPRPAIASVVIDPSVVERATTGAGPDNLAVIAFAAPFHSDLEAFAEVADFDRLIVAGDRGLLDAFPELASRLEREAGGREVTMAPVGRSADDLFERLPASPEGVGVYLVPLFQLPSSERLRLFEGLAARGFASFSLRGRPEVADGVLAGLQSGQTDDRLARRVAVFTQRILSGESPESLPAVFPRRESLVVNVRTARRIGLALKYDVLLEAELVDADEPIVESAGLGQLVAEAVDVNLDLLARRRSVDAGAEEIVRARSALRPRLDASATGVRIDDDRASSFLSPVAERSLQASLSFRQVLYSDAARGNVEIQDSLQSGREHDLEQLRLDIARETAVAYVDLLRARTLQRVRREDLRLARSNLELARVRQSLGTGRPAEVYRWQSQIANARRASVEAYGVAEQARIALARLVDRPQEETIVPEELDLDRPGLIDPERLSPYIDDRESFRRLRDFLVTDGLARAPELERLDAAIAAQRRVVKITERAFWSPMVAAFAEVEQVVAEGGSGSQAVPAIPGFELSLPDDTSWSLGLNVSLPLFTGGERAADRRQSEVELERLELERRSVAERVEQRIRSTAIAVRVSLAGIELSREAAAAAERNLELVADAYARGAADVLDLLDAQNAAFQSGEAAANAVHEFFRDLFDVQRATANYDFFTDLAEREAWMDRLQRFFAAGEEGAGS